MNNGAYRYVMKIAAKNEEGIEKSEWPVVCVTVILQLLWRNFVGFWETYQCGFQCLGTQMCIGIGLD